MSGWSASGSSGGGGGSGSGDAGVGGGDAGGGEGPGLTTQVGSSVRQMRSRSDAKCTEVEEVSHVGSPAKGWA